MLRRTSLIIAAVAVSLATLFSGGAAVAHTTADYGDHSLCC